MRKAYKYIVIAGVLALLLGLLWTKVSSGQSVSVHNKFMTEAWSHPTHYYQHQDQLGGGVNLRWGHVAVRGGINWTRWTASDAKLLSAKYNNESTRVWERRQFVLATARWLRYEFGAILERRQVHHVWRNKGKDVPGFRHDHFAGSSEIARQACNGGIAPAWGESACPSLGYWQGVRLRVAYDRENAQIVLYGPMLNDMGRTLPHHDWRLEGHYDWQRWRFAGEVQGGGMRAWRYDFTVKRELLPQLSVHTSAGNVALPEFRDRNGYRLSFGLTIETLPVKCDLRSLSCSLPYR